MTGIASVGVVSVAALEATAAASGTAAITQADGVSTTGTLTGSGLATPACVSADGVSTTATLAASCVSAASITQAAGASTAATLAAGSITLTVPTRYQMHQRDGSNVASITITGAYTGSPTAIEARFNGGAWSTIVASPAGGTISGTLSGCAVGQGTLEVRFTNATGINQSVLDVGVGDIYIVAGQSNHSGRAATAVQPANAVFKAIELKNDNTWGLLTENTSNSGAFDDTTGGYAARAGQSGLVAGSYFGKLSSLLEAHGVPTAFVPCALGSTSLSAWQPYADHHATTTLYGIMLTRAELAGGHKAMLFWQGESDATSNTAQATYESGLNDFINHWYTDTGKQTIICKLCASGNVAWYSTIRAAQQAVIDANSHVAGGIDMDVWATGNIHYSTSGDITAVATAAYNKLVELYYTDAIAAISPASAASTTSTLAGGAVAAGALVAAAGATTQASIAASAVAACVAIAAAGASVAAAMAPVAEAAVAGATAWSDRRGGRPKRLQVHARPTRQ